MISLRADNVWSLKSGIWGRPFFISRSVSVFRFGRSSSSSSSSVDSSSASRGLIKLRINVWWTTYEIVHWDIPGIVPKHLLSIQGELWKNSGHAKELIHIYVVCWMNLHWIYPDSVNDLLDSMDCIIFSFVSSKDDELNAHIKSDVLDEFVDCAS